MKNFNVSSLKWVQRVSPATTVYTKGRVQLNFILCYQEHLSKRIWIEKATFIEFDTFWGIIRQVCDQIKSIFCVYKKATKFDVKSPNLGALVCGRRKGNMKKTVISWKITFSVEENLCKLSRSWLGEYSFCRLAVRAPVFLYYIISTKDKLNKQFSLL